MKHRTLGSTDLTVSEIGFPLQPLGADAMRRRVDEYDAINLLTAAFDLGVSYFDVADSDGGWGEELLRRALTDQRHDIVVGVQFGQGLVTRPPHSAESASRPIAQSVQADLVRHSCETSLRRLRTDYIDLYQLGNPTVDLLEGDPVFETLEVLVLEGKIRHYGVALGPGLWREEEGRAAVERRRVETVQAAYNMLEQQPGRNLIDFLGAKNVGVLVRSPHASGLLDGTYTSRTRLRQKDFEGLDDIFEYLVWGVEHLKELESLPENLDMTLGQAALKFCLAQPQVSSVLPAVRDTDRLREFVAAPDLRDLKPAIVDRVTGYYDDYIGEG